jgi:DNA uptake protein ComE-like DNA-binding protein
MSGIGEKLAENIVLYRSENGPFENRKQLKSTAFKEKRISRSRFHSHFEC